jgi:hypothetical protein
VGPGYGIYGVEDGMADDMVGLTLPDLFLEWRDCEQWTELMGEESAEKTIPICDWGCCKFSAIDCTTPDGNMLLFVDGTKRVDQRVSFARWVEDWVDGFDVGANDYGRVKRRATWLP